ncbi:MAG: hypothetical protein ABSF70_13245 [Terracidiphilus sp.]|jgi:hypothetical protein
MQPSAQTLFIPMPVPADGTDHPEQTEDWAYQAMTVAAILLVLVSLWVF